MTDNLFIKVKVKNTLFCLDMVTYSYERQDIIQIALKRLPDIVGSYWFSNGKICLKCTLKVIREKQILLG
jgi:hypothetical protein